MSWALLLLGEHFSLRCKLEASDLEINKADWSRLLKLFQDLASEIPDFEFLNDARSAALRPEILKRFVSLVLNDVERAKFYKLSVGCRIREGAKIISPERLVIGEHCWIGENAILDASGGLRIGEHTSIGPSVFIWTHSSHFANLCRNNISGSPLIQRASTSIGSGCFISGPSVIWPGVTVGDNVVIRAFSTIDKDIPSGSLVTPSGIKTNVFTQKMIDRWLDVTMNRGSS
jgi:acetyltransferase-like isoleucine patch superfamily enzyme